jgi:hypothetical protein
MNSFTAIAQSKDTSLAVVAPGIAEALFATAVGLAAAIPAVIFYNQITVALGRAADRVAPAIVRLARSLSPTRSPHTVAMGSESTSTRTTVSSTSIKRTARIEGPSGIPM